MSFIFHIVKNVLSLTFTGFKNLLPNQFITVTLAPLTIPLTHNVYCKTYMYVYVHMYVICIYVYVYTHLSFVKIWAFCVLWITYDQSYNTLKNMQHMNLPTFERSTPVRAFIDGGSCPISFVISLFTLLPLSSFINTISSVFLRGAATSAAIWNTITQLY